MLSPPAETGDRRAHHEYLLPRLGSVLV
jgi:hypothetical protein